MDCENVKLMVYLNVIPNIDASLFSAAYKALTGREFFPLTHKVE
jgi:hypothetical protein